MFLGVVVGFWCCGVVGVGGLGVVGDYRDGGICVLLCFGVKVGCIGDVVCAVLV